MLESTVYPGVRPTWYPELERLGVKIGVDVEIAYCPERFNPGDPAHGVRQVAALWVRQRRGWTGIGCALQPIDRGRCSIRREIGGR